jgi:hypothetical protein
MAEENPVKRMLRQELPREVATLPRVDEYAPQTDRLAQVQAAIDAQLKGAVETAVLRDPINHIADMILLLTYGNAMIIDRELQMLFKDSTNGEPPEGKIAAVLHGWATKRSGTKPAD